jgi:hypothetical protein
MTIFMVFDDVARMRRHSSTQKVGSQSLHVTKNNTEMWRYSILEGFATVLLIMSAATSPRGVFGDRYKANVSSFCTNWVMAHRKTWFASEMQNMGCGLATPVLWLRAFTHQPMHNIQHLNSTPSSKRCRRDGASSAYIPIPPTPYPAPVAPPDSAIDPD